MNVKQIEVKGHTFDVREGTMDEWMVKENLKSRCYLKKIQLTKKDRWLDVGGHVGAFSVSVMPFVETVVSCEPSQDSFKLMSSNILRCFQQLTGANALDPKFTAHFNCLCTAVGSATEKRTFYLNAKTNTGTNSFHVKRGRTPVEVGVTDVNELIKEHGINKLKLDCEGSEVEIIQALSPSSWSQLQEIILEFHFNMLKDKDHSKYFSLVSRLKKSFGPSNVDYSPDPKKAWTTMIHAWRNKPTTSPDAP